MRNMNYKLGKRKVALLITAALMLSLIHIYGIGKKNLPEVSGFCGSYEGALSTL